MKIMIIGPTGKLGRELFDVLKHDHEVTAVNRIACDFSHDISKIGRLIRAQKADVVINATAMNGMEQCAADPMAAIEINAMAPSVMAGACKGAGSRFIHFSTDYVFSGDPNGLHETTPPKPSGVYGMSKLKGEELVQMTNPDSLIFRVSSLYGRQWAGPVDPVRQAMQGQGTPENPVKVLRQFCAPTSTRLVTRAVKHVIERSSGTRGLFHLASAIGIWKRDFASYIVHEVLGKDVVVKEGTLDVPRPVHTRLLCSVFEDTFGYPLTPTLDDFNSMRPFMPMLTTLVAK